MARPPGHRELQTSGSEGRRFGLAGNAVKFCAGGVRDSFTDDGWLRLPLYFPFPWKILQLRSSPGNKQPSRWGTGGFRNVSQLCADDICRLEALGALQQIKLHGLTLVERAVAVLLNSGEVHEYIFSRGALDESISLRPVKPLHCTFLSHGKTPFTIAKNILRHSRSSPPVGRKPPSEIAGRTCGCVYPAQNHSKNGKDSSALTAESFRCANFGARQ